VEKTGANAVKQPSRAIRKRAEKIKNGEGY
jgi:hypothetical protein